MSSCNNSILNELNNCCVQIFGTNIGYLFVFIVINMKIIIITRSQKYKPRLTKYQAIIHADDIIFLYCTRFLHTNLEKMRVAEHLNTFVTRMTHFLVKTRLKAIPFTVCKMQRYLQITFYWIKASQSSLTVKYSAIRLAIECYCIHNAELSL